MYRLEPVKTSAGLNWDAKGYGPVEYPGLVKKDWKYTGFPGNVKHLV